MVQALVRLLLTAETWFLSRVSAALTQVKSFRFPSKRTLFVELKNICSCRESESYPSAVQPPAYAS